MRAIHGLFLAAAGLFLALTYLLIRGDAPDAALHQRTLTAFQTLALDDAALQRDLLRARAGLLGSYDPLVEATRGLRRATAELRFPAGAEGSAAIPRLHAGLAAAVEAREELVEEFKSGNALLQNSTRYFAHASDRLTGQLDGAPDPVAAGIAALGSAMHRFTADPGPDSTSRLGASLDRLAGLPTPLPLQAELQALVTHGRLIASTQPAVDELLARLLATPMAEPARALRDAYLTQYGRAEARAELSRLLLYLASVLLLAYLGHVFLRLRARLRFERLIASIAAGLVGLPRGEAEDGVRRSLARLAGHLGAERAYVLLPPRGGPDAGPTALLWQSEGLREGWPAEAALARCDHQGGGSLGKQGIICVPMRGAGGGRIGFLGFETLRGGRHWGEDDAALLGTAGEIFAHALERERAAAEREALESELRQAQRMEAIGTLAGGIAHDFNNILGAIMGHAEMAMEKLPRGARVWEHVQQIWKAGERARGVIDQILAFSRRGEPDRRPVRLRVLCEETIDLLRASLPATVTIELQVEADIAGAVVSGDPGRLQLVVINLCTNGAQAMDGRGVLTVRLDSFEPEQEFALSYGMLGPGHYLRLAVADTGRGMDAATAGRIFEPFFTTRRDRGGTGLGLATTQAVVADHGGALNLRSRPGTGSTFEVYLPRAEPPPDMAEEEEAEPIRRGNGETVLLVDDEQPLVLLGEEMLAALGYEPVGFDSAPRALAAFRADPGRFDLALTDEVMPDMTGTRLAMELHGIRPDLPVVLMTGYGGPAQAEQLREAGIREVLRKPLASRSIAGSVARQLRRPADDDCNRRRFQP